MLWPNFKWNVVVHECHIPWYLAPGTCYFICTDDIIDLYVEILYSKSQVEDAWLWHKIMTKLNPSTSISKFSFNSSLDHKIAVRNYRIIENLIEILSVVNIIRILALWVQVSAKDSRVWNINWVWTSWPP